MRRGILSVIAVVGAGVGLVPERALAADTSAIETVIVTAEKRSEDIQSIPVVVQAFTAKAITDLGIKSSTDLSQFTPNVDIGLVAGNGNQPIVSIRGVGLNDYDTNNAGPNGIYVDQVYLSSPASQTFQTFDLQRIEVLKGPQGTLYGRNTSGGAINYITKEPADDFTAEFHGEYGAFDTYQLEGAIGGPIAENLDARVAIVKNGSGGYTFNSLTGTRENGANNIAGRAEFLWHPAEGVRVLLNVHGGSIANRPAEYRHLGGYDPATLGDPNGPTLCSVQRVYSANSNCVDLFGYGTPRNFYGGAFNRREHLDVHSWGASLRSEDDLDGVTLTSITAFEHNDKLHPEDSDASPNRLLEINFGVRSATFSQEIRASQSTDAYNWVFGVYYLDETLHQNQPLFLLLDADDFFGGPGSGDGTAEKVFDQNKQVTDSFAVFGQGDYNVTDDVKLTLGARVTHEAKSFVWNGSTTFQSGGEDNFPPPTPTLPAPFFGRIVSTAFNWRAAVDYTFREGLSAYVSAASGFKSGGFNGSFLNANPDPAQVLDQLKPIKPENVYTYEVGIKGTFLDQRLLVDAALFYNDYHNEQVFILVSEGPNLAVNELTNVKNTHMEGVDLEVIAKPIDELTLTTNLGLLQAKFDSPGQLHGNQQSLAPHVTLSTLLDYRAPLYDGTLDVQFGANYKDRQFFDAGNSPFLAQRAYWLENARLGYSFDDDHWEVAAFVRNLSGQKYFVDVFDLSFVGFYQGIMGQPRTWGGEVNFHY